MNMLDFERDFEIFLKERFGTCWGYDWEGEGDGFSVTLQVWNVQPTYPMEESE